MAILRAGPWGELGDEFQDPVGTPTGVDPSPVNCAKNNWPNQDWGAVYEIDIETASGPEYEYGVVGLGEDVVGEGYLIANRIIFCWQATEEFDINLNWDIGSDYGGFPPNLYWVYQTIEGDSDSDYNYPSTSGTETVTLPATTFGRFSYLLSTEPLDFRTLTTSIS